MRHLLRRCVLDKPFATRGIFNSTIVGSLLTNGIKVGSFCEVKHSFGQEDVNTFASICGDNNPIHIDPVYAEGTMFKGTIVHGIFVSSLFSTLFGRSINGAIYVSQSMNFKRPVHVGVPVIAKMSILSIDEKKKGLLLTCSTQIFIAKEGTLAVDGKAEVLVPHK
jgi:3-hydroxybutyryl-CoA dehydratase